MTGAGEQNIFPLCFFYSQAISLERRVLVRRKEGGRTWHWHVVGLEGGVLIGLGGRWASAGLPAG